MPPEGEGFSACPPHESMRCEADIRLGESLTSCMVAVPISPMIRLFVPRPDGRMT